MTDKVQTPCELAAADGSTIRVTDEQCLMLDNIDPVTNKGAVELNGSAQDDNGNQWEISTWVDVKWKRVLTGCGKCACGGNMVCKNPKLPKANVRCQKCGNSMYLSNWKRLQSSNVQAEGRESASVPSSGLMGAV